MLRNTFLLFISLSIICPATADARTQTRVRFQTRFVAKTGESPDVTEAREKLFENKAAEKSFSALNKSLKTGGSCYVCHQKGSKRPHNAFGWAAEQLGYQKTFQGNSLTKSQVDEIFTGKDTAKKNELADHFADAAVEALDYWIVLNGDGELQLSKDATDENGNPLTFGRRIAQGKLPTTEVDGSSFNSVFPKELLDKLNRTRAEQ
jgi:hypothetical protein